MSLRDRIAKAFRLGPASVDGFETTFGHDQTRYAPEKYGDYAATNAAVYACSNIRAKNLAKLRLRIYKRTASGERVEVTSGRLFDLMRSVNGFWTFRRLIRMTEMSLCAYGQAFWILENGVAGRTAAQVAPKELWWANPANVKVVPDPVGYIKGYLYEDQGNTLAFDPADVIWLKYDNPVDEFAGLSPIASARLAIDTAAGAMRSNRQIFDSGMMLSGVIGPADKTSSLTREQAEQLSQMLERRFKGADKAHRTAVLTQPISFTPLNLTPKDAEFMSIMNWGVREVCTVYGVAPQLIGDQTHSTYSNYEQAAKALWTDTLLPEARFLADEVTEQLVPLFGTEADEVEFDTSDIETLQEDRAEVIDQITKLVGIGVPLNRALQELAPRFLPPGETGYAWGDTAWLPATLVPVSDASAPAPATPAPAPVKALQAIEWPTLALPSPAPIVEVTSKAWVEYGSVEHQKIWKAFTDRTDKHEAQFMAALREYFRRQGDSVSAKLRAKAIKDAGDAQADPFDLAAWNRQLRALGLPLIGATMEDGGQATLDDLNIATSFDLGDPRAVTILEGRAQRFARAVNETTWNTLQLSLAAGLAVGEDIPTLQLRVVQVFTDAATWRTEAIARTEVIGASNAGSLEGAKQSGVVTGKNWLAALDARTRETHVVAHRDARNRNVPLDADFHVGGDTGPAPHQLPSAKEVVNCRCTMTYEVG
jgi:HK97 family phage portal protein